MGKEAGRAPPDGRRRDGASGGRYEIRFGGHLDPAWAEWFDGLALEHLPNGETVLRGELVDQAALYGTLAKLRDLGLALIAVRALTDD